MEHLRQLASGTVPERYLRNIGTVGIDGQIRLLRAKIAVVGAGGLGGMALELLARQGAGFLRIIDGDTFAVHNLNRQLVATAATLGENKAVAAVGRIAAVNPDTGTEAVPYMLDADNAAALLDGMDVAVDALDNIPSRLVLAAAAREAGIPLVHAAIAGFTGQVATIFPGDRSLERIYRTTAGASQGIEAVLGNPAATPALAAALQVQEVVKLITGVGEPLRGKMLYFDTGHNLFEIFSFPE